MCGIFCLLNSNDSTEKDFIASQFNKCASRGPEYNRLIHESKCNTYLGFHRLAINGLDEISHQPITIDDVTIICNGEIYNYKELFKSLKIKPSTNSDCEIIIHLYKQYGIDQTLQMLDGVFAFVIYDIRTEDRKIIVARDPYGVRPLFQLHSITGTIGFGSLLANLSAFKDNAFSLDNAVGCGWGPHITSYNDKSISQFPPGTYSTYICCGLGSTHPNSFTKIWTPVIKNKCYSTLGFLKMIEYDDEDYNEKMYLHGIREFLCKAVEKRVLNTDRKVACLLSGGLDSSLMAALVSKHVDNLETYSIGLEGSEDLKYARLVADFLKTKHTEVVVSEEDFFNAIPRAIKASESWDTTTIRACVGNFLLGEYISKHSEAKVIFNGDGSDEVTGGYLYFHKAPDMYEFDSECRKLLNNIHLFDGLRSDRCISVHGLEPRTPFLDRSWVQYYLSIPIKYRCHNLKDRPEKYLLRKAFDCGTILPAEVLWRTKEAFSDGVSNLTKSWYEIIEERVQTITEFNTYNCVLDHLAPTPITLEQKYYRYLFETFYPGCGNVIPYYWMPKYVDATDSSARTLNIYKEKHQSAP